MILTTLRYFLRGSSDLGSITLDQRRLDQAQDFTAQELEGSVVSVTKVPAWRVKREQLVQAMQQHEKGPCRVLKIR